MIEGSSSSRVSELLGVPVWRDWWAWVRDPRPDVPRTPDAMSGLRVWQSLLILHLLLMAIVVVAFLAIQTVAGDLPDSSVLDRKDWSTVVALVLLAPIIEELLFRGWLPGKRGQLLGLLCGIMLPVMLVVLREMMGTPSGGSVLLVIIGWLAATIVIFRGAKDRAFVPPEYRQLFPLVFWLSNSLFAVMHMLNYKDGFEPILILMVVPQFIGGTILAYTRLRVGLRAAMAMHASSNGLAVLLVFSNA